MAGTSNASSTKKTDPMLTMVLTYHDMRTFTTATCSRQLLKSGDSAQNPGPAASVSARNLSKERINFSLSARNPSCLTPFTRLIPAANSGLSKPESAAS
jgi:hypothetical protein